MHMYEGNKGRGQADQALCSVVPITLVRVFNIVLDDSQYISISNKIQPMLFIYIITMYVVYSNKYR